MMSETNVVNIATIISIVGVILAFLGLIWSILSHRASLKKSNEIQQDILMHDMIKEEISNWKYIHEQKENYNKKKKKLPDSVKSHIFNYYEYLAYLIRRNKINPNQAKDIWKPNILGMYGDFKDEFLGDRKELKKLCEEWDNN